MKIVIGSDHRGYEVKQRIVGLLQRLGHEVTDVGPPGRDSVDYPDFAFAVADVWRDWPMRDACTDLVISIFAPRNFAEAARVLRPGGVLAVAFPGPDHLIELRREFGLIDQSEGKTEAYAGCSVKHGGAGCGTAASASIVLHRCSNRKRIGRRAAGVIIQVTMERREGLLPGSEIERLRR